MGGKGEEWRGRKKERGRKGGKGAEPQTKIFWHRHCLWSMDL